MAWITHVSYSLHQADNRRSWQNWEPFSMDNWILLMKKQKRLKAVEIGSVDRDIMRTYLWSSYFPFRIEFPFLRHVLGLFTL